MYYIRRKRNFEIKQAFQKAELAVGRTRQGGTASRGTRHNIGRNFDDNWGLPDPTGKSDDEFISVIKSIEKKITKLKAR